jgi:hypothetical protein
MTGKNIAISIYCDDGLVHWIDSLPGRSRNEKIVELLRQSRGRQEQAGNIGSLQGLQACVSGLVQLLVDKQQLTDAEARQLLMKHAADAEQLVSRKTKEMAQDANQHAGA